MMNFSSTLMLVASALAALATVHWAYFKILKIAKSKDVVDHPGSRKLQITPIPVMGGIAVFIGVVMGMLVYTSFREMFQLPLTAPLLPVMMAMGVMLYVGAMDDTIGLSPRSRIVIEVLVILGLIFGSQGAVDNLHGVLGIRAFSWWIAVPLTVFAGVGIINAVNMVDGVNGLSSGLCIVYSLLFGLAFLRSGDTSNAVLAFVMMVSLLPFYFHNVFGNYSRMFIGDAGTMVMGVLLVWFTISVLRTDSPVPYYMNATNIGLVAMTLAFLSVPVFDTLRVMTMRVVHGKNPFHPDKTHLHHVFISAGVSHFITSTTIITINLLVAGIWALTAICKLSVTMQLITVVLCSMLLIWGIYAFMRYHQLHQTPFMNWLSKVSVATHLGGKKWWKSVSRILDAPEFKDK